MAVNDKAAGDVAASSEPGHRQPGGPADSGDGRIVVIGIGNRHRGDDAVGLAILDALREHGSLSSSGGSVALHGSDADVSSLIELWEDAALAIVIDAIRSGAPPGTLHQHDVTERPLPTDARSTSTHALGLADAVELARNLDSLPGRLIVVGVEVSRLDFGDDLSEPVAAALPAAVEAVLGLLNSGD